MSRRDRRVQQLLADQATEGLDASRARELRQLLALEPHRRTNDFEWAAAAASLALAPPPTTGVSAALLRRLTMDADRYFCGNDQNDMNG